MHFNSFSNTSPCTSSSSEDDSMVPVDEMTPTELLSLAIKKRRSLYNRKERDFRCELLQTSFITSLCKHMGESRKRRRGGKKRTRTSGFSEGSDAYSDANSRTRDESIFNGEPLVQTLPQSTDQSIAEPEMKKCKIETPQYMDPFGLDEFFKSMRSGSNKGEASCDGSSTKQ